MRRAPAAGRPGARTLIAAAPATAALACLYLLAVGTAGGRLLDAETLQAFPDDGTLEALAEAVLRPVNALTACIAAFSVIAVALRRAGAAHGTAALALIAASNLSAAGLKAALGAVDPVGGEHARALGAAFYPSGHATAFMSLALAMTIALAPARLFVRLAYWLAGLAGLAIVASGSHYTSDVLGGYVLAALWAAVAIGHLPAGSRETVIAAARPGRPTWMTIAGLAGVAAALGLAAWGGVVGAEDARLAAATALIVACAAVAPLLLRPARP